VQKWSDLASNEGTNFLRFRMGFDVLRGAFNEDEDDEAGCFCSEDRDCANDLGGTSAVGLCDNGPRDCEASLAADAPLLLPPPEIPSIYFSMARRGRGRLYRRW
jgi:hypothetical protein